MIDALAGRLVRSALGLAAVCLVVMMLVGAADVMIVAGGGEPIPFMVELSELMLVCSIFLALGHVTARGEHISVEVGLDRLPRRLGRAFRIVGAGLTVAVLVVLAWQATRLALASWSVREHASGLVPFPIFPAKTVVAASVWIAAAAGGLVLWQRLTGRAAPAPRTGDGTGSEAA